MNEDVEGEPIQYENRITAESRRPAPDEMVEIFSVIGLDEPFWDPKTDRWNLR